MTVKKTLLRTFLIAIMVGGLVFVGIVQFDTVQASTDVIGIISADTTWTKANSPYSLTGPVGVHEGVTLTIEAGTTVNLNSYYIQVNGTLIAIGSSVDNIHFNGGEIVFTSVSNGWNEQTGSGCIIENAILNNTSIAGADTVKINKNSIDASVSVGGSSIVSNNVITGWVSAGFSVVVSNNNIKGGISVGGGSPVIANNNIEGGNIGISIAHDDNAYISGNTIAGCKWGIRTIGNSTIERNSIINNTYGIEIVASAISSYPVLIYGHDVIQNNIIDNNTVGIVGQGINTIISDNIISGCGEGISTILYPDTNATIERNLIINNNYGIEIKGHPNPVESSDSIAVRDNTIANNAYGINLESFSVPPTIIHNNIQDSSQYNFQLSGTSKDFNATYNWWGTTDTQAINQTIYDKKNDFSLGTVNFVPFLTAPNSEAPVATSVPTPTPSPAHSPTPTSSPVPTPTPSQEPQQTEQLEAILGAAIVVTVFGVGLGLLIYLIKRK